MGGGFSQSRILKRRKPRAIVHHEKGRPIIVIKNPEISSITTGRGSLTSNSGRATVTIQTDKKVKATAKKRYERPSVSPTDLEDL